LIVADSSAFVELLLARPRTAAIRRALRGHSEVHVPSHFHVEVLSALRRYSLQGRLGDRRTASALAGLARFRALTYPMRELLEPTWKLRFNLTTYDAAYLALAQRLDVGLITLDGALAEAAADDGRLVAV
jgi:predicted nucleic acid-binding protein